MVSDGLSKPPGKSITILLIARLNYAQNSALTGDYELLDIVDIPIFEGFDTVKSVQGTIIQVIYLIGQSRAQHNKLVIARLIKLIDGQHISSS